MNPKHLRTRTISFSLAAAALLTLLPFLVSRRWSSSPASGQAPTPVTTNESRVEASPPETPKNSATRKHAEHEAPPPVEAIADYAFLTEDSKGDPVQGTAIYYVPDRGQIVLLGSTGPRGRLPLLDKPKPGYYSAQREGFERTGILATEEPPSLLTVTMLSDRSLAGTVLSPSGIPAAAGVSVIAIRGSMRFPPPNLIDRIARNDPRVITTTTNDDGSFSLHGLADGTTYTLTAGDAGRISQSAIVKTGDVLGDITLRLQDVFAAVIHAKEEDGEPARVPRGIDPGPEVSCYYSGGGIGPEVVPAWNSAFLGISRSQLLESPIDIFALFTSKRDVSALGPFTYTASIPGHLPVAYQFFAGKLSDGLESHPVILESDGRPWGKFRIQADALNPTPAPGPRSLPPAVLSLEDVNGGISNLALWQYGRSFSLESELPVGTYEAQVRTLMGETIQSFTLPISSDQTQSLRVLTPGGRVVVTLIRQSSDSPYVDAADIVVGTVDGTLRGEFDFLRAPYVIDGITPGVYWVGVRHPLRGAAQTGVAIGPGQTVEVSITLE